MTQRGRSVTKEGQGPGKSRCRNTGRRTAESLKKEIARPSGPCFPCLRSCGRRHHHWAAELCEGHYSALPYDPSLVTVAETAGQLYAIYRGDDFGKISVVDPTPVQRNGRTENIVVFYYSETLWSRYIEPLFRRRDADGAQGCRYLLGASDQIDAVFYGTLDSQNLFSNLPKISENAALVWGA